MLICIKSSDMNRILKIPVPYHLGINLMVRKRLILKMVRSSTKHEPSESMKRTIEVAECWLDAIDFGELRVSLHQLKTFKGLALVDVVSADGDVVKIII